MRTQSTTAPSDVANFSKVTQEDLSRLRAVSSEIAGRGGEMGLLAERIVNVSDALQALSARVKRALEA